MKLLGNRLLCGVLMSIVGMLLIATSAFSDGDPAVTTDLLPLTTTSTPGTVQPNLATGQRYMCSTSANAGYGYIRNAPNSFIQGNCLSAGDPGASAGWTFDNSRCDDAVCGNVFGEIYGGHYNHCGWIAVGNLAPKTGTYANTCGNTQSSVAASFMNGWNGRSGLGADGTSTPIQENGCKEFANALPWEINPTGYDYTGRTLNSGATVYWRYITPWNQWVMVDDHNANAAGYPAWVFVARACIKPATALESYHVGAPLGVG